MSLKVTREKDLNLNYLSKLSDYDQSGKLMLSTSFKEIKCEHSKKNVMKVKFERGDYSGCPHVL